MTSFSHHFQNSSNLSGSHVGEEAVQAQATAAADAVSSVVRTANSSSVRLSQGTNCAFPGDSQPIAILRPICSKASHPIASSRALWVADWAARSNVGVWD